MDKQLAEAVVTTTEVSDHPAVRAWRRLYGRPQRVERVKRRSGKRKKSYVYRLTGEGLPNGSVIGKLSPWASGARSVLSAYSACNVGAAQQCDLFQRSQEFAVKQELRRHIH